MVLNRLSIGGPAVNTLALCQYLSSDFEVLLVAGEPAKGEESASHLLEAYPAFKVQMLSSIRRAIIPVEDIKAYIQLKNIIRKFQPQIVHTHGSKPGVIGRLAAFRAGVPVIVHTYHGHIFHAYFHPFVSKRIIEMERWLAKKSTCVIAINEQLKKELVQRYRIAPERKVLVNKLGVEVENLADPGNFKRESFRKQFSLAENELAIGIVGRLVPVKNHALFIWLTEQLLKEKEYQVRFFIIGDGGERLRLIKLLNQKNIRFTEAGTAFDRSAPLIFTSWQKNITEILLGLDLVVLTSVNEGTPVSIMEAMAVSRPVVASAVGGIPELFMNNVNGYTFNSPEELLTKVVLLINDSKERIGLGKRAGSFAQKYLNVKTQVYELAGIYKRLAEGTW
ncbi:MAG: glycosyltransferase [Chitinophagaceae bacterium]